MSTPVDLTGVPFGDLVCIRKVPAPKGKENQRCAWWLCRCSCGKEVVVSRTALRRAKWAVRSCGCKKPAPKPRKMRKRTTLLGKVWDCGIGIDGVCPECKKPFLYYSGAWAYKIETVYYCSWHCLRAVQARVETTKGSKYKRKEGER